jgi:hypothetical protein
MVGPEWLVSWEVFGVGPGIAVVLFLLFILCHIFQILILLILFFFKFFLFLKLFLSLSLTLLLLPLPLKLLLILYPLIPHDKPISLIHLHRPPIKLRFPYPQLLHQINRQSFSPFPHLRPYPIKTGAIHEILCNSDGVVQIQNRMPPVPRHKNSLTRSLNTFKKL